MQSASHNLSLAYVPQGHLFYWDFVKGPGWGKSQEGRVGAVFSATLPLPIKKGGVEGAAGSKESAAPCGLERKSEVASEQLLVHFCPLAAG